MQKEVREAFRVHFKWTVLESAKVCRTVTKAVVNSKYRGQRFIIGQEPSIKKERQDWPGKDLLPETIQEN